LDLIGQTASTHLDEEEEKRSKKIQRFKDNKKDIYSAKQK